jgi:hypothetical protein
MVPKIRVLLTLDLPFAWPGGVRTPAWHEIRLAGNMGGVAASRRYLSRRSERTDGFALSRIGNGSDGVETETIVVQPARIPAEKPFTLHDDAPSGCL